MHNSEPVFALLPTFSGNWLKLSLKKPFMSVHANSSNRPPIIRITSPIIIKIAKLIIDPIYVDDLKIIGKINGKKKEIILLILVDYSFFFNE
ncbi:hypothetical protein ES703_94234 [subsurface metagenome]